MDTAVHVADLNAGPTVAEFALEMAAHEFPLYGKREIGGDSAVDCRYGYISVRGRWQAELNLSVHRLQLDVAYVVQSQVIGSDGAVHRRQVGAAGQVVDLGAAVYQASPYFTRNLRNFKRAVDEINAVETSGAGHVQLVGHSSRIVVRVIFGIAGTNANVVAAGIDLDLRFV